MAKHKIDRTEGMRARRPLLLVSLVFAVGVLPNARGTTVYPGPLVWRQARTVHEILSRQAFRRQRLPKSLRNAKP